MMCVFIGAPLNSYPVLVTACMPMYLRSVAAQLPPVKLLEQRMHTPGLNPTEHGTEVLYWLEQVPVLPVHIAQAFPMARQTPSPSPLLWATLLNCIRMAPAMALPPMQQSPWLVPEVYSMILFAW